MGAVQKSQTTSASQVAKTLKPTYEPLCLADLNHAPTVAPWLRQRNAALLAPIKGNTAFERCASPAGRAAARRVHAELGARAGVSKTFSARPVGTALPVDHR